MLQRPGYRRKSRAVPCAGPLAWAVDTVPLMQALHLAPSSDVSDVSQARREAGVAFGLWRRRPSEAHRAAAEAAFRQLMAILLGVSPAEIHVARGVEQRIAGALNLDLGIDPAVAAVERTDPRTVAVGPGAFWSLASLRAALGERSF